MIACIAIAATMAVATEQQTSLMVLPLALATVGLLASLIGIVLVRARSAAAPEDALRSGTLAAPVVFAAMAWFLVESLGLDAKVELVQ